MIQFLLRSLVLIALMISVVGCNRHLISAQSEYITRQGLASYRIGTPDPHLNHPVVGQRLMIKWWLPDEYLAYQDLHIEATIRFHNNVEKNLIYPICKASGIEIYTISADEFCQTNGIVTYKVNLVGNGCILSEWRHQLWVDFIEIKS